MERKNDSERLITISDTAKKLKFWFCYLASHFRVIALVTLVCLFAGFAYALIRKPVYIAESTFALEENENAGLGQYSGLAALAGIPLNSNNSGLFAGDNILELYKSRSMLKKTLLSRGVFNTGPQLLVDRYIASNGLRKQWSGKEQLEDLHFDADSGKSSILRDSILFDIIREIKKKNLAVGKADKKLSVVYVTIQAKDELFAREFDRLLVANVNSFYVSTRIAKASQNLRILQQQTDSVHNLVISNMSGAALANDYVPNANPAKSILHTSSQKKLADMQANSAVYTELLKNLELAKINLQKETPLIQLIDQPDLPLEKQQLSKILYSIGGALAGFFAAVSYLLMKQVFGNDN